MSEIQRNQSPDGLEHWALGKYSGYGKVLRKGTPTNGDSGYANQCEWVDYSDGSTYINVGTASSAVWVENDPSNPQTVFGSTGKITSSSAVMAASGNLYRTILTTANEIQPSATGALKIVDIFTLPANSFMASGQGLQFSVWCNNAGTSGHAVRIQIVANPSNVGLPASGAGVAGKTDGTVTLTGGTVVLDTGASYSPTGTVTFGIVFQGQIFKTGAAGSNTQESMLTGIVPQVGLTHTTAWADLTLAENAAIVFAVVISAATTATDIEYQGCEITGFN